MQYPLWLTRPFAAGTALAAVAAVAAIMAVSAIGHFVSRPTSAPTPAPTLNRPAAERSAPSVPTAPAPGDAGIGPVAEGVAALDPRFDAARAQHDLGNVAEAFAALATLADEGHCEAARLALQMIYAGPEAYLMSFRAGPKQMSRWRSLPNCWPQPVRR
jgi:hypothetical protein